MAQIRKDEKELLDWFIEVLRFRRDDRAVASFDNLKNGIAVVQLLHSIAPHKLDLARCDFLASTPFHFGKNWKLVQEACAIMSIPVVMDIDMVMEGQKQRNLHVLCQYLKHHYDTLKRQFLLQLESGPEHHAARSIGQPQCAQAKVTSPSSRPPRAISSVPPSSQSVTEQPAATVAEDGSVVEVPAAIVTDYEFARRAQNGYDPEVQRAHAIDVRKKRLLSRAAVTDLQSGEAASHRSGDSLGVQSYMSGELRARLSARATNTNSPSIIEIWAKSVQAPKDSSRGSTPVGSVQSPTAGDSIAAHQTLADGGSPAAAPSAEAVVFGESSPPSSRAPADLGQQLAAQMHFHKYEILQNLSFFSLVRRHHQAPPESHDQTGATAPAAGATRVDWECIEDVEGDVALGYIPYEQLVELKKLSAAHPQQPTEESNSAAKKSSAWDAFDTLFSS